MKVFGGFNLMSNRSVIPLMVFFSLIFLSQTLSPKIALLEASSPLTTGTYSFSNRWGFGFKEGSNNIIPLYTDDNDSRSFEGPTSTLTSGREFAPAINNNSTDTFLENDISHDLNGYYRFYVNNLDDLKIIYDLNYGSSDETILTTTNLYFILFRHSRNGSTTFDTSLTSITNQFNNISITNTHFEISSSFIGDQFFKFKTSASNVPAPAAYKSLFAFNFKDLLGSNSIALNEVVIKFHMQYNYGGFDQDALKFAIIVDGQTPSSSQTDLHGPRIFGLPSDQFEENIIPIVLDTNKPWWTAHKSGQEAALSNIYLDSGPTYQKTNLDGTSIPTIFSNADVYYVSFLDYLKNGTQTRFRAPLFTCTFNSNPCVSGTTFSSHLKGSDSTPINTISATINNTTITYFQTEYWLALVNEGLYTFNVIEFSGKTSSFSVRIDKTGIGITVFKLDGLNDSNQAVALSGSTFYHGFGFRYSSPDKNTTVTIKNTSNNSISYQESFLTGSVNQVITYTTSNFNAGGNFTIEIVDQANNKAFFDSNPTLFIYSFTLVSPKYNLTIDENSFNPIGNRTYFQNQDPQTLDFSSLNGGSGYGQWQLTMSNAIQGSIPISFEENQFRGLKLGTNIDDNTPDQVKLLTKNILGANASSFSYQNQMSAGFPKIKAVVLNISTETSLGSPNPSTVSLKVNNTVFANSSKNVVHTSSLSQDRYLTFEDTNGDIGHLEITINHFRARALYIREISIFALADADLLEVVNFANDLSQYDTCDFNDSEAAFIQLNSRYQDFSNTQKTEIENLLVLDYGSLGLAAGKYTLAVTAGNKWRGLLDISEDNIWGNAQLNSPHNLTSILSLDIFLILLGNFLTVLFFFKFKKGV